MRVPDFLSDQQVAFETLWHPPAFTAAKRAKYLHVPGRQVAKSVLVVGPHGPFLAVLPATHHIDTDALAVDQGGSVRLARQDELDDVFRDCAWGVVPPFGTLYGLSIVLDDSLRPDDLIVFEGNIHGEAVRMLCRDFERLETPRRLCFAVRGGKRDA